VDFVLIFQAKFFFDEQPISTLSMDEWTNIRREKIAVVFQDLQLFPDLTVQENLLIKNKLTDFKTENEIKQLVQVLGIEQKWSTPCGLLSMGQQQRVAIIRALCQPFSWLVMDEPFSHLDEENKRSCLDCIVGATKEQQAGFILTSLDDDKRFQYDYELKL
jgi:ABC-type lipoprotein export system ATPase subunit